MRFRHSGYRKGGLLGAVVLIGVCHTHLSQAEPAIVPARERAQATGQGLSGPTANRGIRAVNPIGTVPLAAEFTSTHNRQLRAREIVVEPGGVVAVHEHQGRPGMAYILEGEIVEHRNDHPEPILRKQGDAAFERTGVAHWWENRSDRVVRALVVDIVPLDP